MLERFFHLAENETTAKTELGSGIIMFLTALYILFVNGVILSQIGMPIIGVFVATALAAATCTFIVAFYANLPFMMAPGMSINSFFAVVICLGAGYHWKEALCITFIAGIVHVLLILTPFRKKLVIAIPEHLGIASGAGLGLLIAFIGIANSGLFNIEASISFNAAKSSLSSILYFQTPFTAFDITVLIPIIAAVILLIMLAVEQKTGEKYGALPISILLTAFICIPFSLERFQALMGFSYNYVAEFKSVFIAFLGYPGLGSIFATPEIAVNTILIVALLTLTNIMDSFGTIIGLGFMRRNTLFKDADKELFNRKGAASKMDKAMIVNSFGGVIAPLFGSSTATIYLESSAGILFGGRTGLSALVAGLLFIFCIPIIDVFRIIPIEAMAPAMVYIGSSMMSRIRLVDWDNFAEAFPTFIVILLVPLLRSVLDGICIGIIAHIIIALTLGAKEKPHFTLYGIAFVYLVAKAMNMLV